MKKLMVAAAIVCAAVGVQAAAISWGGAISTPDMSATLPSGTMAYLVYSSSAMSAATSADSAFAIGTVLDNGGTIKDSYSLNGTDSTAWTFTAKYDSTEAGSAEAMNGYYAVLVQNPADGTLASYYDIGQVTGVDDKTGTISKIINEGWTSETGPSLTENGWTVQSIPEPTSGLLLLLGMAGLALRRRRA